MSDQERIAAAVAKRKRKLDRILNTPQALARRIVQEAEHDQLPEQTYPEIPDDSPEFT